MPVHVEAQNLVPKMLRDNGDEINYTNPPALARELLDEQRSSLAKCGRVQPRTRYTTPCAAGVSCAAHTAITQHRSATVRL
jgi:hypothetical protein